MSGFIHKTNCINIILMCIYPAGLFVSLPIIQVQESIISTAKELPAIAAEGHAEDAKLAVIWTEGQRLVLLLQSKERDLMETIRPGGVDKVLPIRTNRNIKYGPTNISGLELDQYCKKLLCNITSIVCLRANFSLLES